MSYEFTVTRNARRILPEKTQGVWGGWYSAHFSLKNSWCRCEEGVYINKEQRLGTLHWGVGGVACRICNICKCNLYKYMRQGRRIRTNSNVLQHLVDDNRKEPQHQIQPTQESIHEPPSNLVWKLHYTTPLHGHQNDQISWTFAVPFMF